MKYQNGDLLEILTKGFDCLFIPKETFDSSFIEFEKWYIDTLRNYSELLENKSPIVTNFIIVRWDHQYITSVILDDIKRTFWNTYQVHHSLFEQKTNEILHDENYHDIELKSKVMKVKEEYENLCKGFSSEIGRWETKPVIDFLEERLAEKILDNVSGNILFNFANISFSQIFDSRFQSIDTKDFIKNNVHNLNSAILRDIYNSCQTIFENEIISKDDMIVFNFFRFWRADYKMGRKGREELGIYNLLGNKIGENTSYRLDMTIFIYKKNQIIFWTIDSKGSNSRTHLKRQIKQINTEANLLNIHFHGNHFPIGIYLDSSKDAVDTRNSLLSA